MILIVSDAVTVTVRALASNKQNQASNHSSCENKYNNCMFERELREEMKQKRLRKTMILKVHHANGDLPLHIKLLTTWLVFFVEKLILKKILQQ